MIEPNVQALAEAPRALKCSMLEINLLAKTKYPQSAHLEQIPGVGPITALYFVLKIEDPARFKGARCRGLCRIMSATRPEQGERSAITSPECGRRLSAPASGGAAQYILGPFRSGERPAPIWIDAGD